MTTQLSGKTALVTGGARGIGAAISRALAREGATVLVNYSRSVAAARGLVAEIAAAGGTAHSLQADVGDPAAVRSMFEQIDQQHRGRIDVLVNNAGIAVSAPLDEFSDEDFQRIMSVNVGGAFYVTRAAVRRMEAGGRIISIGSVLGERAIGRELSLYVATKFAVAGLARGWAHDLARRGITSNVVQPGPIDTDMNPADPAKNPSAPGMTRMVPIGRYGQAEEVAAAVVFLASPAASYITGATLNVDGGMNA